jgi:hypothetical protein
LAKQGVYSAIQNNKQISVLILSVKTLIFAGKNPETQFAG